MIGDDLPAWMDKADRGAVAVIKTDDGRTCTAKVLDFDEETNELVVESISARRTPPNHKQKLAIPIGRITTFEVQPRAGLSWPDSDPCKETSFKPARFALMATIFLCMIVGSALLFVVLMPAPYAIQAASALEYTSIVLFMTFARTGSGFGKRWTDWPPYMFTCPAVKQQLPSLLLRHLGWVAVVVAVETWAKAVSKALPAWWNLSDPKGTTPLEAAVFLACAGLMTIQIYSNRRLLDRAHRDFAP